MADKKRLINLLQKFGRGTCTAAELEELNEWYDRLEVPGNEQQLWQEKDPKTREITSAYFSHFKQHLGRQRHRRSSKRVWWSIAAAMMLAVGVSALYLNMRSSGDSHKMVVAEKGAKTDILLPDGTHVWLNSGSSLRYPQNFSKGNREIWLKGEGYFEVVKNPAKPFIVHTQRVDIRVLGTTFNVRAYDGERQTETTLLTGAVEAWVKNKGARGERVLLKPGDKLLVQDKLKMPISSNDKDTAASATVVLRKMAALPVAEEMPETQWLHNKLVFDQQPLEAIFSMLERWYNVKINCTIKTDPTKRLTGTFQGDSLTDVLTALQLKGNFRYKITGQIVTIY